MNRLLRWQHRLPTLTALAPVFLLWEVVGRLEISAAVPRLGEIWDVVGIVVSQPGFREALVGSLRSFGIGFGLALLIGIGVGAAMAMFKPVEEALNLYVNMFMGAPMAAFVPLLVAIFGVGSGAIVATVFIFSVFIVLVNTYAGVRSASEVLLEMARSFGAPPTKRFLKIVLPSAMPLLLTGVRLGFSRSVSGLILGEMLIVVVGFGGLIMQTGSSFRVDQLWVLIFIALSFALLGSRFLEYVQRRVVGWASTQGRKGAYE